MATLPVEPVEVQTSSSEALRQAPQQPVATRWAVVLSVAFLCVVVVAMLVCLPMVRPLTPAASAVADRSMYLSLRHSPANGVGFHDRGQTLSAERKKVTSFQDPSAQFQAFVPVLSNQAPDPLMPATHPGRVTPPRVGPSMAAAATRGQRIAQDRGASSVADPERKVVFMPLEVARPFRSTTMKWGALVGTKIPDGWVEDVDYDRHSLLEPGSLVAFEQRVDGEDRRSVRFGQLVKSLPTWDTEGGGLYEVVRSMNDDGTPGATANVEGIDLLRPAASSLTPVLENMPDIKVVKPGWFGIGKADSGLMGMFA